MYSLTTLECYTGWLSFGDTRMINEKRHTKGRVILLMEYRHLRLTNTFTYIPALTILPQTMKMTFGTTLSIIIILALREHIYSGSKVFINLRREGGYIPKKVQSQLRYRLLTYSVLAPQYDIDKNML